MNSEIIHFRGKPLFQRAQFQGSFVMMGEIKDFACFFYMTKGVLKSYDSRGAHILQAKEAITKNCGNYVQKYELAPKEDGCEAIAVYLYPELLKEIYKDEVPSFLVTNDIPAPKKFISNQLIDQYMVNLSLYFQSPESLDEELGILKLKELIMILLKSENHKDIRFLLSELFANVHLEFEQIIARNIYNPLNIEELAFICNMSISSFKRNFKKHFNSTPARYIKIKRLEKAANSLLYSNDSVSAIAYDCGFQDASTFSTNFHEIYGMSPSNYRLSQNRN